MHRIAPLASLTLSLVLTAGCVSELDVHPIDERHDVAFVAQDEELLRQLSRGEDGWLYSPVLAVEGEEAFNRAGFRYDASAPLVIEGRASQDGGETFGDWLPAETTFSEEQAHNAHVDVPEDTTHVQLRFEAAPESNLAFLAVELFEYVPPAEGAGEIGLEEAADVEQGLAADGVAVSRAAWGARASRCTSGHTPNRMTVHHTVTPNNDSASMPARMRQIQNFHMNTRGWCDVGYHFLVGQDGRVYQGRPERKIGAHAGGDNTNNAGVSFIGTFTSAAPSSAMMNAGARILKSLSQTYGITLNRTKVKGHRQVGTTSTTCPGNALYNRLQNLIDLARGNPGGGGGGGGFCAPSKTGTWCDGADLVVCNNGSQTSRNRCAHGCKSMPQGTPDQCEAPPPSGFCATHGGTWCDGNDLVVCEDQQEVSRQTCAHGCQSMPSGTPDQCVAPPPAVGSYDDVPQGHSAYAAAEALREAGALYGCGTRQFCPGQPITRAELAFALARLDGLSFTAPSSSTFNDVPQSHWGFSGIEEVASRGVITGCTSSSFCPDDGVSRAAGAVFLRRAKGWPNATPGTSSFADVALSHWASGAIERMFANQVVNGCADSPRRYCPSDALTRGQAALMLQRAYNL